MSGELGGFAALTLSYFAQRGAAQLEEYELPKLGVAGSTPSEARRLLQRSAVG